MPVHLGHITAYTIEEIAHAFEVNIHTIRGYIRRGELKARKIGKRLYVSEEAMGAFLLGAHDETDDEDESENRANAV